MRVPWTQTEYHGFNLDLYIYICLYVSLHACPCLFCILWFCLSVNAPTYAAYNTYIHTARVLSSNQYSMNDIHSFIHSLSLYSIKGVTLYYYYYCCCCSGNYMLMSSTPRRSSRSPLSFLLTYLSLLFFSSSQRYLFILHLSCILHLKAE